MVRGRFRSTVESNGAGSLADCRSIRAIALVSKLTGPFDLGDIVMSNSVVRYVRQRFPDSRIVLIARPDEIAQYTNRFYARHSWIDEFHACPELADRSWRKWLRFYFASRALKVDLCIASIGSLPAWFMFAAGIPLRMGVRPANRWLAKLLTHPIAVPSDGVRERHWTDVAAAYVAALGGARTFRVRDIVPYVRYDDEALDLAAAGLRRPVVAMHIGGAMHWNRRWPRECYLQICVRLSRELGASIALVGGDEEKAEVTWLTERLKYFCPEARINDFAGCSINRVLNLYSQADLYIGNDSGLMHLAVAMGLPVVAVFGPSSHRYLGPDKVDSRHQVVTADFPCSRGVCPLGCSSRYDIESPDYAACMNNLDASSVWTAVTRTLCPDSQPR